MMVWSLIYSQTSWTEVKWVLGSITTNKASGNDGIPAEVFQILKHYAAKVQNSICQQVCKTQQLPQDWKKSVVISVPKDVQTTAQLYSFHFLARSWSKFSKGGVKSTWTEKFQKYKLDLEKAEEAETKLPTSIGS